MTLETQKLHFIESFLKIDDIDTINRLQSIVNSNVENIQPISLEAYYQMIDESIEQHQNGEVVSNEDMQELIESW